MLVAFCEGESAIGILVIPKSAMGAIVPRQSGGAQHQQVVNSASESTYRRADGEGTQSEGAKCGLVYRRTAS